MRITVNGQESRLPDAGTVADVVASRTGERRPSGVAVAVNDEVVRRDEWERHPLADGDTVEIVTAVQGG